MIRTRDTGEIYLLSLDTFMIMAVMGLTLGTIFFIVNPKLVPSENLLTEEIKETITRSQYERCLSIGRNLSGLNVDDESLWVFKSSNNWELTFRMKNLDSTLPEVYVSGFNELGIFLEKEEVPEYLSEIPRLNNCFGFE